ncbi:TRAP transporter substrate-binding protein [Paragemmobacter ruber]
MTANSQWATGQIVPEINAIGLPFLFADAPTAWRVLDGDAGAMIDEKAQAAGLEGLAFRDNGIRHVSHMSKSIATPADLAGMKIRTPPDDMTIAIFTALGANPAPLAFAELPTALQSGVFGGQENPMTNIYSSKIHEITKCISLTGHKSESAPLLASLAWWSSLSPENRGCVQKSATAAMWYQRGLSWEASSALMEPPEAVAFALLIGAFFHRDLSIGLYTPPVGTTLFISSAIARTGIGETTRALLPFYLAAILVLLAFSYIPALTIY